MLKTIKRKGENMEAYIEIWTKGAAKRNERPDLSKVNPNLKYYHIYIKDDDGIHSENDLLKMIADTIHEMEQNEHRNSQSRFPNFMELREY